MYDALRDRRLADSGATIRRAAVEDSGQQEIAELDVPGRRTEALGAQAGGNRVHRHLDLQFVESVS